MSDDPKNPDEKQNAFMGDLFKKNASEADPNELPDDIAFQGADSGAEEPTEAETTKPEAQTANTDGSEGSGGADGSEGSEGSGGTGEVEDAKPQQKATNNPNVIPINGRQPATADAEVVTNPELAQETKDTAEKLRRVQSAGPVLSGKDADLVRWNKEFQRIEPTNAENAALLSRMGEDADIYANFPGEMVSRPMQYNADTMAMTANSAKNPRPIQRARDIVSGGGLGNIEIQTDRDRLKRMSGQDPDSEKEKQKKEAADRKIQQAMEEKEEQEQQKQQRPRNSADAMLAWTGEKLSKLFAAIGRFLKAAVAAVVTAGKHIQGMVSDVGSNKASAQNATANASDEMPTVTPKSAEELGAAIGNSGAEGAASSLAGRVNAAKQSVSERSSSVAQEFQANGKKNLDSLNKGLGTHEVGSELIKSDEAFKEKLASRSPQDKAKVTRALNNNRELSENLKEDVRGVVEHPEMGMLPAEEKARILNGLSTSVSQGYKTDHLSQLAANHAVDDQGVSFTEQTQKGVSAAQAAINGELEKANQQAQIEQVARQSHHQAEPQSDEHSPRPG